MIYTCPCFCVHNVYTLGYESHTSFVSKDNKVYDRLWKIPLSELLALGGIINHD